METIPFPESPPASRLSAALAHQAELHLDLARAELARDLGRLGRNLVPVLLGAFMLAVGYTALWAAIVIALAPWLGAAWLAFLCGLLHVLLGGIGLLRAIDRLADTPVFHSTIGAELGQSAREVAAALAITPQPNGDTHFS